ncbi:hypothetical protein Tco_1140732 [Tanacetum coccineum]
MQRRFGNINYFLAQMFGCLARRVDSSKDDMVCVLAWWIFGAVKDEDDSKDCGSPSIYENGKLNDEKVNSNDRC